MAGLSGLSVGIVTVGGLLVYAGIRGVTPLQALRDVSSGQPIAIPDTPGTLSLPTSGGNVALDPQTGEAVTGTTGASVSGGVTVKGKVRSSVALSAVSSFKGDKYSQPKREKPGFSDCSSFVCKGFHAAGVAKPDGRMAWPNTSAFAIGPAWKTIPQSQAMPGDIAVVSGHHMVFVTNSGGTQGIGQQNLTSNVRTGSIASLFINVPGKPVFRTYVGS